MSASFPVRTKSGGWVKAEAIDRLCRWCRSQVEGRRRTFCSDACVHEWKLRTDPGYLRERVLVRDKGICARCGTDTLLLRRDLRKLDYASRRNFLKEWGLLDGDRKSLWDADHIVPVAEGGGQCDLANMRTLCLKCHRQETAALRARLKAIS